MLFQDIEGILAAVGGIGIFIAILVIVVLVYLFALKAGIGAVKGNKTELGTVFVTALINIVAEVVLGFIPLIGWLIALVVVLLVIKSRHNTTFFGALGALIIAFIIVIIVVIVLAFVFLGSLTGLMGLLMP